MKTLKNEQMTETEYHKYILEECERQWNENQKEELGDWDSQSKTTKEDYYNELYSLYADLLGKACCDCCYLAETNNFFYCNCGDSENYKKQVEARNYCNCMEY